MLKFLHALLIATLPFAAQADPVKVIQYFEHQGKVEVAVQGGQVTISTPFAIASIGKTMTSVAMLRLVARGKVRLDDPAKNWLPGDVVSGLGGLQGVTIRHLLNMTSGLPDYLVDAYVDDAIANPSRVQNPRTALSYAYGERALFQPGRDFDYSNTNYVLAGLILESVAGQSYANVINREVLRPAGMRNSFVFGTRALPADFPFGHEDGQHERAYYQHEGFGDGGVIATAHDLALFYRALFVSKSLLSPLMMTELMRDPLNEGYGLGIDIDRGIYGHSGGDTGFSSDVRFNSQTGAIAITLMSRSDADTSWTEGVIHRR